MPAQITIPMEKLVSSCAGETYCTSITKQQPAMAAISPEIGVDHRLVERDVVAEEADALRDRCAAPGLPGRTCSASASFEPKVVSSRSAINDPVAGRAIRIDVGSRRSAGAPAA